jgi:hypothetical protein
MTFRDVRNKVRWAALTSGVLLVGTQWYKTRVYPKWNGVYPSPELDLFVLGLIPVTFMLALFSIPRWQSWCALASVGWAIFLMAFLLLQGHEP